MDTSNSDYRKEKNKIKNDFKLKPTHSFTSLPFKIENGKESIRNNENKFTKKKSIISQDNNFNKSLFSSINELFHSKADKNDNKEYNFKNKIYKRYKNINEIKEDKKYFHLLYLSTNLIEIIKKKKKYQINENYKDILQKENNEKENIISNLNNQNYLSFFLKNSQIYEKLEEVDQKLIDFYLTFHKFYLDFWSIIVPA